MNEVIKAAGACFGNISLGCHRCGASQCPHDRCGRAPLSVCQKPRKAHGRLVKRGRGGPAARRKPQSDRQGCVDRHQAVACWRADRDWRDHCGRPAAVEFRGYRRGRPAGRERHDGAADTRDNDGALLCGRRRCRRVLAGTEGLKPSSPPLLRSTTSPRGWPSR